jgi:hypothetical protein
MEDDMDQNIPNGGDGIGPLTGLAKTRAKLKARQIADLERHRAALLARRDIIDRDIKEVDEKLDGLRETSE